MMKKPSCVLVGPLDRNAPRPGQYAAPPLGIHRMAAYARQQAQIEVTVIDPSLIGVKRSLQILSSLEPPLVGFSTLAPTLEADLRLLAKARRLLPHSLFFMGGQGVAGLESLLVERGGADIVVRGFGEEALVSLAALVERGGRSEILANSHLADIPNLTVREPNGKSYKTRPAFATAELFRSATEAIDFKRIPYPQYWEVNRRRYPPQHIRLMRNERLLKTIRMMTQSHCPMGCNYCSSTRFLDVFDKGRQTVLMQEPEEIVATMERALVAHPDTTAFYFNDDDFVLRRSRALRFAELVLQRLETKHLSFIAMTRVDNVDEEIAYSLARAGFRLIFMGVESFAPRTVAAMEKHVRTHGDDYTSTARRAVLTLLKAGIAAQIGLILFYPAVREEDLIITIENTVDLIGRGARISLFPLAEAYPGASLINSNYEISTKEIMVGGKKLELPVHFLPEDTEIRKLAEVTLEEHQRLRATHQMDTIPQPVDSLLFLQTVLRHLGRDTTFVERVLRKLESEHSPRSVRQYINA